MNLCNIKDVYNLMTLFGLRPKKELGQNFLTDRSVVAAIAESCEPENTGTVLEIGPGMGVLTQELSGLYSNVVSLEIDEKLIPVLRYTLDGLKNVEVINADVMKTDLRGLLSSGFERGGVSVCANLPYYITSPILMYLLESDLPFRCITVMVQKEVAERLCARPGERDAGAITLAVAYRGEAEMLMTVPADRFIPAPKVDSAVVRIRLYDKKPFVPKNEDLFFSVIRASFSQRRKTLVNGLSSAFGQIPRERLTQIITDLGLRADIRGEKLTVREFCRLSDAVGDEIKNT